MSVVDNRSEAILAEPSILATHMVGTWRWDIVHDRVTCDRTNAGLLGLMPDEANRGVPFQRIVQSVHPDDREHFTSTTAPARKTGGTVNLVVRTTPAPNVVRRVNMRGRYEADERGVMVQGYGVLIDLTNTPVIDLPPPTPSIVGDPISRSAALCRSARQLVAETGTFQLRTLLDMVLLEYERTIRRGGS